MSDLVMFRIVVPRYRGERIVGPWIRDVPFYIEQAAKIWISREVTFSIEFATPEQEQQLLASTDRRLS